MPVTARACPKCSTTLPPDAAFCHKCGMSTPHAIDRETGHVDSAPEIEVEDLAQRARLQAALGDGYEVRRLLGRGGFAEVYVAFDNRLKREIAVKTIRGDLVVNDTLLERFQREAEAVAKLRHPNIIPIYAVGEGRSDGEDVAWFAMPLIEGESLAERVEREGSVPVGEACRILREAASALNAAHRAGLVHRDIKPENIMLEGPERSVIVMDFGIAKSETTENKGLTGTGMLVGTPHFMSPEQATGERDLDARSDQYALAMVGYRMLTGRFPFEGDSVQTLIFKTVTEIPPAASTVNPQVPHEVSDVLAKAMSKMPAERYESMAAFGDALDKVTRSSIETGAPARRRPVDMATRTRTALAQLPRLTSPWVIGAVLSVIVGIALAPRLIPATARQVAAGRDDADFAAKTFLRSRGVTGGYVTKSFDVATSTLVYLSRTLGPRKLDARVLTDIPVWTWSVRTRLAKQDEWVVQLAQDSRIVGFEHVMPDTMHAPAITVDSARTLAQQELVARGLSMADLEPLPDSSAAHGRGDTKSRTDYVFRWREKGHAIQWKGTDSAHVRVRVNVNGTGVVEYALSLHTPDSYRHANETPPWVYVGLVIGWTIAAVMVGFAFALGVARQPCGHVSSGARSSSSCWAQSRLADSVSRRSSCNRSSARARPSLVSCCRSPSS